MEKIDDRHEKVEEDTKADELNPEKVAEDVRFFFWYR